jgi:putative nucleotidyltransferase with HDIG domain
LKGGISINLGNILLSLSESIDLANKNSVQHQLRTAFVALELARYLNLDDETIKDLFIAALLHDIGKEIDSKENIDYELQCIRGKNIVGQVKILKQTSEIIRYHYLDWKDWRGVIDKPITMSSQILLLANFVDMMINRNRFILHQVDNVWNELSKLENGVLSSKVVGAFKVISKKEEFWLDLTSYRLYSILLNNGPLRNKEIYLDQIGEISELFKNIVDFKSKYTITHTTGVSACAEILGKLFGLTELEVETIGIAANFHDLGKLIVPNSILEKNGELSKPELELVKSHPYYTYQVLSSIDGLYQIVPWASYHHEKLDGTGYPFHCSAKDLDTGARIIAVSDIFISRIEKKAYRDRMEKTEIYNMMKKMGRNNLIDIKFVDLLFENLEIILNYIQIKQEKTQKFYQEKIQLI